MKKEYHRDENPEFYEEIKKMINYIDEIISCEIHVNKLRDHPIKEWREYFLFDAYYDIVNVAHLMMNDKEITDLYEDFKNSRHKKIKNLVLELKELSELVVAKYVDPEFKESYLKSNTSSVKNVDKEEIKNIRFLKSF